MHRQAIASTSRRAILKAAATTTIATAFGGATAKANADPPITGIQPILQGAVDGGRTPGVFSTIWRRGEVIQVNAAGFRDVERRTPMESNTLVRIASMTKPITVVTALTLIEQGRMKLSDPVSRWAPEFANPRVLRRPDGPLDDTVAAQRPLTIEDLMTHRAGLPYPFMDTPHARAMGEKFGMGAILGFYGALTPDQWIARVASLPLADQPGERFNYGLAMDVLAVVIGRAAKTGFRTAVLQRVCEPLGMKDTDFWIPPAKRSREAVFYVADPARKAFTAVPTPTENPVKSFVSGGAGMISTADDYLAFAVMLMRGGAVRGRQLLKPETVRMMLSNHLTPAQRQAPSPPGAPNWKHQGFGLGVSMITDAQAYAASGAGAGSNGAFTWPGLFGGWWQADPARDMVLLWLTQALPGFIALSIPGAPAGDRSPIPPGALAMLAFQKRVYAALPD